MALGVRHPADDRDLPVTRLVGAIIAPILLGAFIILYLYPDRTAEWFAWGMTALRLENFNHGHVTFYLWTGLYIAAPFVVPGIWILNRWTGTLWPKDATLVPTPIRWMAGVTGTEISLVSTVCVLLPDLMNGPWPWAISPLTARSLLGWFVLLSVVNLPLYIDPRWSSWRITIQSQMIGLALVLVGAVRAWGDLEPENLLTWVIVGGLTSYFLGICADIWGWNIASEARGS